MQKEITDPNSPSICIFENRNSLKKKQNIIWKLSLLRGLKSAFHSVGIDRVSNLSDLQYHNKFSKDILVINVKINYSRNCYLVISVSYSM